MLRTKDIKITVLINEEQFILHTYPNEYRNAMALIRDHLFPDDFGECGGMGRCCTCMIQVVSKDVALPFPDRNEAANLAKHQVSDSPIRLSCQLMVDESLNNLIVRV